MSSARGQAEQAERDDIAALAKGGRANVFGFLLRLAARIPFLFIAGRLYGASVLGRFAYAVLVIEFAAQLATFGLKRGLAEQLAREDSRQQSHIVADAMMLCLVGSAATAGLLMLFPAAMFPNSGLNGLDRLLPLIVIAIALTDVALAACAYQYNIAASVHARSIVEPWTISIASLGFYFYSARDGLILSYVAAMLAAMLAALWPLLRHYGLPRGWSPHPGRLWWLAVRNLPLAAADAIEWGTRRLDLAILGLFATPSVVGIYYVAQQVASLPQKLKTSFDPILGPVITRNLASDNRTAIAEQVRQVAFWIIAAQGGLALMGSIPGEAVMGIVGPQFVAGTAALAFLLTAEVLASTGAVCESALVYMARHRNLMISAAMLSFQVVLSFALIFAMRALGWPVEWQAAGPAVALMLSLALTSVIKARVLGRLLRAPVSPLRWPLLWAALAAIAMGGAFTMLPHEYEWAQVVIGIPAIAATYLFILWRRAFGPADRALFSKMPRADEATLPNVGAMTR